MKKPYGMSGQEYIGYSIEKVANALDRLADLYQQKLATEADDLDKAMQAISEMADNEMPSGFKKRTGDGGGAAQPPPF